MQEATAIVKASDFELDEASATDINTSFQPMILARNELAKEYGEIISLDIDADISKRAGTLRRKLVKVRTGIASVHKTQKHMFLMAGKFVDAVKNVQTLPVTQMEEKLSAIEKHQENIELEKIRKLRDARTAELRQYEVEDTALPAHLGQMEQDVWSNYLAGVKAAYDQRKEAEAKAEEERIAKEKKEAAEQERIRVENAELKKKAEERDKAEAARIAKEAKARKKLEDEARKERDERERLEKEKKDRADADQREHEEKKIREADKAHRSAVDVAIVESLMIAGGNGVSQGACVSILQAMAKGDIPNVSINY